MGRRYVWHKAYEYEVPYSPNLNVEGNENLEWREEPDPTEAPAAAPKKPVRRSKS